LKKLYDIDILKKII